MRVVVVGAGAMGGLFGAFFHDAGQDVQFIDVQSATVDAINEHGLRVTGADGDVRVVRVPAATRPEPGDDPADLILFQVKGYATAAAAELARPSIGPGTTLLTLQNGMGNDDVLRSAYPANPLVIGMTVHSVAVLGPGHIHHTGVRGTSVGPADDGSADEAAAVAAALEGSGHPVELKSATDIRADIWAKFSLNCSSLPLLSIAGLPTEGINGIPEMLDLSDAVVKETCQIARAEGVEIDGDERAALMRELFRTAGGKASMLQDIEAGRRTEIDTINGAAVRIGERHGLAVPLNRAMVALVKAREAALGIS